MLAIFNKKLITHFSFVQKMSQNLNSSLQRAKRVQENVMEQNYRIQFEAKLRNKVSVQSSIQNLEKEMLQQIAKALGRSQSKVKFLIQKAQQKLNQVNKFASKEGKQRQIGQYNELIDLCVKARWEFLVHRQSCGFTIKNYEIVHQMYKIPPKIL